MAEQRFQAKIERDGLRGVVRLPFDPNEAWGVKEKHYIRGTVQGCMVRGPLSQDGDGLYLLLSPSWLRDNPLTDDSVEIVLYPEGPQLDLLADDIVTALNSEPEAKAFFSSLATFYRKGYINWIESAKRPETRQKRIQETVECLKAGKKQK